MFSRPDLRQDLFAQVDAVYDIDLSCATFAELERLVDLSTRFGRMADAFGVRVAAAANKLEASGRGPSADDAMSGKGKKTSKAAGRQKTKRAKTADEFPPVGDGHHNGDVPTENLDALGRATQDLTDEQRAALKAREEEIADKAAKQSPEQFARTIGRIVREITADDGVSKLENQRKNSKASWWLDKDTGMYHFRASFDPERGDQLFRDLNAQMAALVGRDRLPHNDHTKAEAFWQLFRYGVANKDNPTSRPNSVVMITDTGTMMSGPHEGTVSETWAGAAMPPKTVARFCCDADITEVVLDEAGMPLHVGRTHRTATKDQRRALRALYDSCPLSGIPFDRCEVHHVNVFWEHGGKTDIENLVPISVSWHHRFHEGGWTLKMLPDRSLEVWRPDGVHDQTIPSPIPATRRHLDDDSPGKRVSTS